MSIHTKERGCVQRSLSHGGAQKSLQKAVLSAFKYLKNCLDGDFVSFPSFRFLRELKTHKIAFCIRVSAIFFYYYDFNVLYNLRKNILILC